MPRPSAPFLGGLPEHGPWNAVGLTRGQFVGILALATALFVLVGGPLWRHVHEGHFARIAISYGVIPPATAAALHRNGRARPALIVGASVLIALAKLLLTAALLIAAALAR